MRISHLSAGYQENEIVHDLNFICEKKQIYGLIGPNGCGKTTLFHSLIQSNAWVKGECFIDDEDILKLSSKKRAQKISLLPQMVPSIFGYTCKDVLLMGFYPLADHQITQEMKNRFDEKVKQFQIAHLLEKDFMEISAGQKQMVLFVRTLLQDASVILLDEIDAPLDYENKYEIMEQLIVHVKEENKTSLMILHDLSLALAYCDHLFLMKEGKIIDEIHLREEKKETIENKLHQIYPHVSLLEYQEKYIPYHK